MDVTGDVRLVEARAVLVPWRLLAW